MGIINIFSCEWRPNPLIVYYNGMNEVKIILDFHLACVGMDIGLTLAEHGGLHSQKIVPLAELRTYEKIRVRGLKNFFPVYFYNYTILLHTVKTKKFWQWRGGGVDVDDDDEIINWQLWKSEVLYRRWDFYQAEVGVMQSLNGNASRLKAALVPARRKPTYVVYVRYVQRGH